MRLLFVAPTGSLTGGGELSHYELIMAAKKRGHDVHVVVPTKKDLYKKLRTNDVGCTATNYFWWGSFSSKKEAEYNMATAGKIYQLADKLGSECIITNSLNLPWGALGAALANIPHIWLSREMPMYQFSYLEDHYDFIKKYSNIILANSKTNADYISGRIGRATNYLYPYVDVDGIKLNESIKQSRLVNVGSIQPGKNQLELIKAAGILHKKGKLSTPILLIGSQWDSAYSTKVKKTIRQYGLQKMVEIEGFTANPYGLIGPNDIFVQTSVYESFGRTTVEAMKLGLITIAADAPVTKEIMSLGGGHVYTGGKPASLAKMLEKVLDNRSEYKTSATETRKKILKELNEANCHVPFFEALAAVRNQPNPGREFRHLGLQFEGLAQTEQVHRKTTNDYKKIIRGYERDLNNVLDSKSWKTVQKAKKIIRR